MAAEKIVFHEDDVHINFKGEPICGRDHKAEDAPRLCEGCAFVLAHLVNSSRRQHEQVMALMQALVDEGHATPEALRQVGKLGPRV